MFSNDIFVQVEKQIDDWLRKMMSYLNAGNLASIDEVQRAILHGFSEKFLGFLIGLRVNLK